jgi:soluble lytic murein transglycosylase-like protein
MRQIVFAALGFILTAPFQTAIARDHSKGVRSHAAHSHHARSSHRHARQHRYARRHYHQQAYRSGFGGLEMAPTPYESYGYSYGYNSYGGGAAYAPRVARREVSHNGLDSMISRHAQMNGIPESLLHRVVMRESRYNARAVGRGGAMGLMQIKTSTARAMGYSGSASGLLDPETNVTYAARYLAGAYRAAGGSQDRAVSNYARGYYYQAKAQGFSPYAQQRSFGGYATTAAYRRSGGVFEQPIRERPL